MDPSFPPKKQKLRRSVKQHVEAMKEEVEKLKQARAIQEVFFLKWLSNGDQEKERKVAGLCILHQSQSGMP